ncbi:MAG: Fe-S cluster assembly protein SufD [Bacteroidales bacterium]|nr:Fe-S cluster assembly protein SufD [Bacteroidales bacterium]
MDNIKKAIRPKEEDFADFSCYLTQLETYRINQFNGFFFEKNNNSVLLDRNIIICSIKSAIEKHKSILESTKHLHSFNNDDEGLFIYIPNNITLDTPLQVLDVIKTNEALKIESKTVIIIGENSHVKLIYCDDTINDNISKTENKISVFLEANSSLEYYKMENINNSSSIFTDTNFVLNTNAQLKTFWLSINGGDIKNKLNVSLEGEYSKAELNGLYLVDRDQIVDSEVSVNHNKPNCHSNQLYKGILDDSAKAQFKGHIYVSKNAPYTEAIQNNRNILLTDKAIVNTQPFLEIYNDDVKCSHGATVGQLDESAMFYMRSRGISERSAKMLLMFAFCTEILSKSSIEELVDTLQDIIKRRLHGELSSCENCVLLCSTPCGTSDVDMSKIN